MIKLFVTGRLGKDSELKFTATGNPVLNYSIATDVGWGDKKHTVWVNCSTWGKQAEALEAYLKKGQQVAVSGNADLREWESSNGKGTSLDCTTDTVDMMGSKPEAAEKPDGFRKKEQPDFQDNEMGDIPW